MIEPGECRWFDVTVIQNTISARSIKQMPTISTNNTASSIECPHSLVLLDFKSQIVINTIFFVVALNVCH